MMEEVGGYLIRMVCCSLLKNVSMMKCQETQTKKKNRSLLNSASGNKKHDTKGVDEFDENGDLYSPLESINDEM